jgi:hypothetical protein
VQLVDTRNKKELTKAMSKNSTKPINDPMDLSGDEVDPNNVFILHTVEDGFNSGRRFVILCENQELRSQIASSIKTLVDKAQMRRAAQEHPGLTAKTQRMTKSFYNKTWVQSFVCFIILASYIATLVETQMNPDPDGEVSG